MNTTQDKYKSKTFASDMYDISINGKEFEIELQPE